MYIIYIYIYILYIIYLNIQYRVRINVSHFTIRDTFKGTCDSKKITNKQIATQKSYTKKNIIKIMANVCKCYPGMEIKS